MKSILCAGMLSLVLVGCKSTSSPSQEPVAAAPGREALSSPSGTSPELAGKVAEAPIADQGPARIGSKAPGFRLPDVEGKMVSLADFQGKTVVLEWFNPECPFVKNAHSKGSLKGTAERHKGDGVVWLAVNSAAPGKQGHGVEKNREASRAFSMSYPVLLDESGQVGRSYGAERTPHMFVISPEGNLVYAGAIDNSPDGEGESPQGGTLVNYVDEALSAVKAGKAPTVSETKSYGCSVKYEG